MMGMSPLCCFDEERYLVIARAKIRKKIKFSLEIKALMEIT